VISEPGMQAGVSRPPVDSEATAMDGPTLSGREKRILEEIENDLRADGRLDRELSTMRPAGPARVGRILLAIGHVPLTAVALLTALSIALVPVGATVRSAQTLLLFGVIWALTLVLLLARVSHRLVARRRTKRGG
jgi:hypothetical protein